jgi:hypothetical protein
MLVARRGFEEKVKRSLLCGRFSWGMGGMKATAMEEIEDWGVDSPTVDTTLHPHHLFDLPSPPSPAPRLIRFLPVRLYETSLLCGASFTGDMGMKDNGD